MSPPSSSSPPPPPLLSTQYIQASSQKFKGLSLSAHHSVDDSINVKSPLLPAIFTFNITTNCIPLSTNTHLNPKITAKSPMVYKYRSCYDSTDLVHFPIAKQTIDSMLRNTVLRHSDCNMLTNFISVFVQLSARDFLKRGLPRLRVVAEIDIETLVSFRDQKTVNAVVNVGGRGEGCFDVEFPLLGRRGDDGEQVEMGESCPVCLEDYVYSDGKKILCTECWHLFHKECLMRWKQRGHNNCPLCRYNFSSRPHIYTEN